MSLILTLATLHLNFFLYYGGGEGACAGGGKVQVCTGVQAILDAQGENLGGQDGF
ncbi:hypothetical protein K443DRAFT_673234 [Laccaria amethystina LaAM-08-1]|uniref:Uncharacterized protein n=1 Tax=Laccaria amethystina LaAM-08-1 TaxID=1095629 RepID=A0A0C9XRL9_9AGAR|nr:hypothetical protein K443DRAFT_673234 [Laccaria amethystina LaAM-08-1]